MSTNKLHPDSIELEPLLNDYERPILQFSPYLDMSLPNSFPIILKLGEGSFLQFNGKMGTSIDKKDDNIIHFFADQVMLDLGQGSWTGFLKLNLSLSSEINTNNPRIPGRWYNLKEKQISPGMKSYDSSRHYKFLTSNIFSLPDVQITSLRSLAKRNLPAENETPSTWKRFKNFWL